MSVTLNIAGDFCITAPYLEQSLIADNVKELYKKADINIVNLECPVTNNGKPEKIIKHGPHLQTTEKIMTHLQQLNIAAVTCANNHILDYGAAGLRSTILECEKAGIRTVGIGTTLNDAGQPVVIEKNNLRIALVNCCEEEWSIATDNTPGANPLDVIDITRQLKKAQQQADKVVLIVHGGSEHYHLPSPRMVKQLRYFADNGASAVICHHSHCISGYEIYNETPILYGLGNFMFTKPGEYPGWFTGLTATLTLEKGKPVSFVLHPSVLAAGNYSVSLLEGVEKEKQLAHVKEVSEVIAHADKLKAAWLSMVEERAPQYLYNFSGIHLFKIQFIKGAIRRLGLIKNLLPKMFLTSVINYISCEAHRDIALEALKKKLYKK